MLESRVDSTIQRDVVRSTWVSLLLNVVLSIVQVVIGLMSRSQALIADGMHSLSDVLSDVVVLVASRHSHRPPDADHAYGHRRFENAASGFLGLLLVAVGLGMLWSASVRLANPAAIPQVGLPALYVAVLCIVAKEGLYHYLMRVARRHRSSLLAANAWHSRSDAASSLVVAAGIMGNRLGYPLFDALAAAIVGFLIVRMGWQYSAQAFADLTDRAVPESELAELKATLLQAPGVAGVHALRTRRTGDVVIVDVHLEVAPELSVTEGHWIAEHARELLRQRPEILDVQVHIDPGTATTLAGTLDLPSPTAIRAAMAELALPEGTRLFLNYEASTVSVDVLLPQNATAVHAGEARLPDNVGVRWFAGQTAPER